MINRASRCLGLMRWCSESALDAAFFTRRARIQGTRIVGVFFFFINGLIPHSLHACPVRWPELEVCFLVVEDGGHRGACVSSGATSSHIQPFLMWLYEYSTLVPAPHYQPHERE